MKQKSIKTNAVLNVIRQGLNVIFPLITYPYALRILGAEGIGKVSFGNSIISYFSLLAAIGVTTYAVREGAKYKEDNSRFNAFASQVFTINVIFTILSYILLGVLLLFSAKLESYRTVIIILSTSIALTTLGIDWVNTIFEDFWIITVRSIAIHIISLGLLFLLIHKPEDYYLYAILTVTNTGIVCLTNLFYCRKYVHLRLTAHPNFKTHLKPMLIMFANIVTVSVYVNIDTTMLGWMKGDYYVGIYSSSVRVYTTIKHILSAIYFVAVPQLSFNYAEKNIKKYNEICTGLWRYLTLILIPAGIGLICLSNEIMLIFGGREYIEAVTSLQILGVALIFAIFGGMVTSGMNVTMGREADNLKASIISALMNFALNFFFIKEFYHNGAALTTLFSELFVFVFCFIRIPNKKLYIDFKKVSNNLIHSAVGSVLIIVVAIIIKLFISSILLRTILIILLGIIVYAAFLRIVKDQDYLDIESKIVGKIKKLRN